MVNRFTILLLIFGLCSLNAFSQVESKKFQRLIDSMYSDEVERISVEQAAERIDSLIILDIRSVEEYEVSHLKNAEFIDYDSVTDSDLNKVCTEQDVLVYCSIGVRSEEIGIRLQKLGYTVYNLEGGIFEWKNQEMPVVDKTGVATDSVHVYSRLWSYWMKNGIKVY